MALTLNGSNNTIAGLAVGGLPDGIVDTDMLAAKAAKLGKIGDGGIIQVVEAKTTTEAAHDSSANTNYSSLSFDCNITPISTSSKIILTYSINFCTESVAREVSFRPTRGGTPFNTNNGDGARHVGTASRIIEYAGSSETISWTCVDSPNTTSQVTYGFQHSIMVSGCWIVRNRSFTNTNNGSHALGASFITAMEVAG